MCRLVNRLEFEHGKWTRAERKGAGLCAYGIVDFPRIDGGTSISGEFKLNAELLLLPAMMAIVLALARDIFMVMYEGCKNGTDMNYCRRNHCH
mmetsp:Transcript_10330/g.22999  ORF Transcript_10330/g.22999 Transcript_10330/m.22999 type:complete len:93 (-) Transcript_10330:78-356(-)